MLTPVVEQPYTPEYMSYDDDLNLDRDEGGLVEWVGGVVIGEGGIIPTMTSHIGLYDSGMGGISVMHEVHTRMPAFNLLYLADTAYCPYGPRSTEEVRERARVCTNWLVRGYVSSLLPATPHPRQHLTSCETNYLSQS